MTDKILQARHMYMNEARTQKEIAQTVGVTERTLYNWIKQFAWEKLRQAAWSGPAVIAGNLCSQLVEMQNAITAREVGKRFPTIQEAEITRKIVTCVEKLKKYPSLSQNMQVLETFRNFVRAKDQKPAGNLGMFSQIFLEANARNGFFPYEMEFGTDRVASVSPFYDEDAFGTGSLGRPEEISGPETGL